MSKVIEQTRVVVMGAPQVGKTALIKRMIYNTFEDKYKPTIEELYSKEYEVGGSNINVDILDTAGDLQFPAMRRLSIATSHAFLLVYSVDDASSFEAIKCCLNEIRDQRQDYSALPIVISGNKSDVNPNNVVVAFDDVAGWISQHFSNIRIKLREYSAKENSNVELVFRFYLELSKGSFHEPENPSQKNNLGGADRGIFDRIQRRQGSAKDDLFASASDLLSPPKLSACFRSSSSNFLSVEDCGSFAKSKPRSRSLIRRCSKKGKNQELSSTDGPGECQPV